MGALLRALSNLLRLALLPLWFTARLLARPRSPWLELRLSTRVQDLQARVPLWQRLMPQFAPKQQATSLEELREAVRVLVTDSRIVGLLLHMPGLEAGWAACASLRDIVLSVRAAGKQVVCYLPEGGGSRELYVALAADRVVLAPPASVAPLGLAAQPFYVKGLLDRVGVEVQVQATGEYKSAAEPALRESMSEASREQSSALLAAMHDALVSALHARPGMDAARIEAVLARGLMTAGNARDLGLIDDVAYEDELLGKLSPGLPPHRPPMPLSRYLRWNRAALWHPVRDEPYIAVVPVRGTIVGTGFRLGPAAAELSNIVGSLRAAARDPRARAVVLYVNSPGGSAHASDLIHREVQQLAARKPVVAYLGDVAASGGYYVAVACRRIVAQPVTITGSIGVISIKVAIEGLLARLGIRSDVLQTAPHVDMFSLARKFTGDEERMMQAHAAELYARFLEVVAQGRGKTAEDIHKLARGRVWSGRDALAHELVDVLGGFDSALDEARGLLTDMPPGDRAKLRARAVVPRHSATPAPPLETAAVLLALERFLPDGLVLASSLLRQEPNLYYAASVSWQV